MALKDKTMVEAIKTRDGGMGQVNKLQTGYGQLTVGDVANLAAQKVPQAEKAMKILKQAASKAQKYGNR